MYWIDEKWEVESQRAAEYATATKVSASTPTFTTGHPLWMYRPKYTLAVRVMEPAGYEKQ